MTGRLRLRGAARGVASITLGTGAAQAISIAAIPVLSRIFPPDAFGYYAAVTSLVTVCSVVAPLRFDTALAIARRADVPTLAATATVMAAITALLSAVIMPGLTALPEGVDLRLAGVLVATAVFTGGLYSTFTYLVLRARNYQAVARRNIVRQLAATGVQAAAGCLWPSFAGLMVGLTVGQVACLTVFKGEAAILVRWFRRFGMRWRGIRAYWRFPVLLAPAALLNSLGVQLAQVLIANHFGAAAAGNLFQALRLGTGPATLIGTAVSSVVLAELAAHVRLGELNQRRRFIRASKALAGAAVLWLSMMVLVAPSVLPVFLGEGWADAGSFAAPVGIQCAAVIAVSPLSVVLIVYERAVTSLLLDAARVAVVAAAGYLAIAAGLGAVGTYASMAVGLALVYAVTWICCLNVVSSGSSGHGACRS